MPSLKLLPSEICFHILQLLPRKDVGEYITLCKSWYQPFLEEYYKKIRLSSKKIEFLKARLFLKQEDDGFQQLEHGKCIIELEIYDKYKGQEGNDRHDMDLLAQLQQVNAKLEKEEFLHLLSFLKNLKILDLAKTVHSDHYMAILQQLDSTLYLKRIEWINTNTQADSRTSLVNDERTRVQKQLDFLTYYNFAQSITRLHLYGYSNDDTPNNNLSLLSQFRNLNYLVISNPQDADLTLFHILDACQHLKTLDFTSFVNVPNNADKLFENMVHQDKKTNYSIIVDCPLVTYSQSLESLVVDFPSLTLPYIKYLTNCLPNALTTIEVAMENAILHSWIEEHGVKIATDLLNRLMAIKNVQISTFLPYNARVRMADSIDKMARICMVLDMLSSGRKPKLCSVLYSFNLDPVFVQTNEMLLMDQNPVC